MEYCGEIRKRQGKFVGKNIKKKNSYILQLMTCHYCDHYLVEVPVGGDGHKLRVEDGNLGEADRLLGT